MHHSVCLRTKRAEYSEKVSLCYSDRAGISAVNSAPWVSVGRGSNHGGRSRNETDRGVSVDSFYNTCGWLGGERPGSVEGSFFSTAGTGSVSRC